MRVFVDTNLWVYWVDWRDPRKMHFVAQWLRQLASEHDIVVSTQVMIELRAVMTHKLKPAFSPQDARTALAALTAFDVVGTHANLVLDAHELAVIERLSWFDALIAEAALRSRCEILYSEDFSHGRILGGRLQVINPFQNI